MTAAPAIPLCRRCSAPLRPSLRAPEIVLGQGHDEYTYEIRNAWWVCNPCMFSRGVERSETSLWTHARRARCKELGRDDLA